MSIRFRVRVINNGIPLEEVRDDPETMTVGQLVGELSRIGFIPTSPTNVTVVVFRKFIVGSNRSLVLLFETVPESDRLLEIWLVPPEIRDLLDSLSDEDEDDDLDADEDFEAAKPEAEAPPAPPPPPPPSRPVTLPAPAPGAPPPRASRAQPMDDEPPQSRKAKRSMPPDSSNSVGIPRSIGKTLRSFRDDVESRRATVRYYDRMNPQKVFPFLVTLTAEKVKKILQKGVAQTESKPFEVKLEESLSIEPILPGCTCYPAKAEMKITAADTAVHFWVVPQVLGKVKGAKVTISQEGRTLTEVELDIKVRRTNLAIVLGLVTLLYPVAAAVANQFGIDFKNLGQLGEYLTFVMEYVRKVSPMAIFGGLLAVTGFLYWWSRPRMRDQFWDLDTEGGR